MGVMVIVAYRPKPGCEADLETLVREHVPCLRTLGLVTERPAQAMRAKDGTIVEVFEWADGAIEAAHNSSRVAELWERFASACDYVPLRELPEAEGMFAEFEPIAL
ncbi:hypothetical protein [Dyella acidiphila]|uniref:ABM domain-containing protein n=1 Tax=Dyella acidiphila TaxID=2775866 RepID=A0ABR9GBB3_9GAMM|nr:hypothetical protein [Dyella acidiphila]MBE1161316.1 hypothetical protein [Dyella acidiphila]